MLLALIHFHNQTLIPREVSHKIKSLFPIEIKHYVGLNKNLFQKIQAKLNSGNSNHFVFKTNFMGLYFYDLQVLCCPFSNKLSNYYNTSMEDYVIIGSVLQAKHMSDFIKRPKHVRKYEIKSSTYTLPFSEYSLYRQPPRPSVQQHLQIQKSKSYVRKSQIFLTMVSDKKKTKTKAILQSNEKLSETCKDDWNKKHFDEFFIKKEIEPRTPRQHVIRRAKLSKTPEVTQRVFYDADFSLVKSKSRECIILPEGRHTERKVDLSSTQSSFSKINIQELIDNEWQASRRKRKIQNKTSSLLAHEKTKLQKEAKRIEEELRNRENDEKFGGSVRTPFEKPRPKQYMIENFKKSQLPLGKDEVNMKTSFLMEKYRIDQSKICLKISNK